jgi:hypothetical protein
MESSDRDFAIERARLEQATKPGSTVYLVALDEDDFPINRFDISKISSP